MPINTLTNILEKEEIQVLQEKFSKITGVSSLITDVDGSSITGFTGFCTLCSAIRQHPQGKKNCQRINGNYCLNDSNDIQIHRCPSIGLWESGAKIYVGEKHIANWIIGQLKPAEFDFGKILRYTDSLELERSWVLDSLDDIRSMDEDGFKMILEILQLFANQLSSLAYRKYLLKKEVHEKNALSRQLNYLTFYDPETGLLNRALCIERIQHLINMGKRVACGKFSLLMISPDKHSHHTEIFGTVGANKIIKHIADILQQSVRQEDTVCRFSEDEFLLILESADSTELSPENIYQRICESLDTRLVLDNSLVKISVHAGMVQWASGCDENVEELIKKSYAALMESKNNDGSSLFSYTDDMYKTLTFEYELEKNFEMAILNGEIIPYYQPIVRLDSEGTSFLYGYEVLARWNHPQYGILSPGLFIPIAEKHDILDELSQYLIRRASSFIREVNTYHNDDPLFISVNITPDEFIRKDFVFKIEKVLKEENLPGKWIKLEITENSVLKGGEDSLFKIKKLNELGISLSMDDFGTGYSNLALLCRLPLNNLKLDQSLIQMAEENENFIQAIINMANSLDMEIIAEGVETQAQIDILKRMGCHIHQGFFYAHPMDSESVRTLHFANSPVECI
ncbi:MAG: hypothetical protein B6241_03195 [Spirochaetaceae bacterium 4572_59]|nr:MAG: hypothetical protein B6241_03195 [Spirochaetaceae bacterium 4572_59]